MKTLIISIVLLCSVCAVFGQEMMSGPDGALVVEANEVVEVNEVGDVKGGGGEGGGFFSHLFSTLLVMLIGVFLGVAITARFFVFVLFRGRVAYIYNSGNKKEVNVFNFIFIKHLLSKGKQFHLFVSWLDRQYCDSLIRLWFDAIRYPAKYDPPLLNVLYDVLSKRGIDFHTLKDDESNSTTLELAISCGSVYALIEFLVEIRLLDAKFSEMKKDLLSGNISLDAVSE
jgi:hypothetical protein